MIPPEIAGCHPQRLAIAMLAGIGVMGTFMPWYQMAFVGSVAGYQVLGLGWITIFLFLPAMILSFSGERNRPMVGGVRLGSTIPAGMAALLALSKMGQLDQMKSVFNSSIGPIPLAALAVNASVSVGLGLYLVLIAGVAICSMAWLLRFVQDQTHQRQHSAYHVDGLGFDT